MDKDGLNAEVRVDSLGRSITRWVRKDKPSPVSASIPKPTLQGTASPATKEAPLDISLMGTTRGWITEKLTPRNAKQRGTLIASILNVAHQAALPPLHTRGPGRPMPKPFEPGESMEIFDIMSKQALEHLDAALKRDKHVNGFQLFQEFQASRLRNFVRSAKYLPEFEMLNLEDMSARGGQVSLNASSMENLSRLRKSSDKFDRPDVFNMSEQDRNSAAEVLRAMNNLYDYYQSEKFPVRITHCILEHPGRVEEIESYLIERIGRNRYMTEDDADGLREYLSSDPSVLNEGML